MHPPTEHRQPKVRVGHHTEKLEMIREQLNQSKKMVAQPIEQPPVETPIDNARNIEMLMACGLVDRGRALEALRQTSSVGQALQWIHDNRTNKDEYFLEGRSSEMPIASTTSYDSGFISNGATPTRCRTSTGVGGTTPVMTRVDYPRDTHYQQRIIDDGWSQSPRADIRLPSPSHQQMHISLQSMPPSYSLPFQPSSSTPSSSTTFRSPSPSASSSSSRQAPPTPVHNTDYSRTHLKFKMAPPRSDQYDALSQQMSVVTIQKMNERITPASSVRSSPASEQREHNEPSNSVPVMKARLQTDPHNLRINVNSTGSGRQMNANISTDDMYHHHSQYGGPSTSSSILMNADNTSTVVYHDKIIRHPRPASPDMNNDHRFTRMYNPPPTTSAPSYIASPSYNSIYNNNHAASGPPPAATQVFVRQGRTTTQQAPLTRAPNVSAVYDKREPAVASSSRMNGVVRSHSPLPEGVRTKLKMGTYSRSTESCKPRLFRFFMEQHVERLMEQQKERVKRADQLRNEMDEAKLASHLKDQLLEHLIKRESRYMRLRRQKMNKDMFEHIQHIGVGAFGRVSLVRKKDTRAVYAMKSLLKKDVINKNQAAHVKAERDILAEADSPWIVRLYFSFQDERCLYFIMEYVPGGDMMELLIKKGWFDEADARFYIAELTCAIDYVHSLGFIHRDIKPDNILIDRDGHLKLTDFGLCTGLRWTHDKKYYGPENDDQPGHIRQDSFTVPRQHDASESSVKILEARHSKKRNKAHSLVGTTSYMAPEVVLRTGHTQLCDWWSVGVILYEMVYGRAPFTSEFDDEEIKTKIINFRSELKLYKRIPVVNGRYNTLSDECISMIRDLCREESDRLGRNNGAEDVQNHPWFRGIDFANLRQTEAAWRPQIAHELDTRNFEHLELVDFPFDSLRGAPINNPAFYEFTFRHFYDTGPPGSMARNGAPLPSRSAPSRLPLPFDLTKDQRSSAAVPASPFTSAPIARPPGMPPSYFSATSAAAAANTMQHIREASAESIEI